MNKTGHDAAAPDHRFIRLMERWQEPVLRTCFLYLRDKTLAEDALQETFLRVYRSMAAFRGECSEKTWIMKIAMHVCYDMNHSGWFRFINRRITPDLLPDRSAEDAGEGDEALTLAVMRLPRKQREVILLYYYQELKVHEIAQALGITHGSVSGRLIRGRRQLKRLLEGRDPDE